MQNPSKEQWQAAKRIIACLNGSKEKGLVYKKSKTWPKDATLLDKLKDLRITVHTDSDWAQDKNGRKSTSGYLMYLNDNLIDWASKKQRVVAQSSCEAELIAATTAMKQVKCLQKVMHEMITIAESRKQNRHPSEKDKSSDNPNNDETERFETKVKCWMDSQSAMHAIENGDFTGKLKHIETRYYYLADEMEKGRFTLAFIKGTDNPADLMTKPVTKKVWRELIHNILHD